jgi:hypothetical protein
VRIRQSTGFGQLATITGDWQALKDKYWGRRHRGTGAERYSAPEEAPSSDFPSEPRHENHGKDLGMAEATTDKYSAGKQGLGYIYQGRLALYQMLQLPESTTVFLEKDDDVDFEDCNGGKSLASLKHKAEGERLTDLSTDFWKSVRIWLHRYKRDDRAKSNLRFFLFTTAKVGDDSFLTRFLPGFVGPSEVGKSPRELADDALAKSSSTSIGAIAQECLF